MTRLNATRRTRQPVRAALRLCAAAALATAAGACTGDSITDVKRYREDPMSYLVGAATDSRIVATVVAGNPFGTSPDTLASVVAAALHGAFPAADVRFAIRPEPGVRDDVSLVVAFGAPAWVGPKTLCARGGRVPAVADAAEVPVVMAFCRSDRAAAGARGRISRGAGLGDREFVSLIRDMARRMFEGR